MSRNQKHVENVYKFGQDVRRRDGLIYTHVEKIIVGMLQYKGDLARATKE